MATFYTGLFVGAAIAYGFDWDNHGHGWHGGSGEINIGGDVNIGNTNVNLDRTNIDRDKIGVNRGRRDTARDRRQATTLSDSRRRSEGRPSRAQEGLGRGQRGAQRNLGGLAPAGRDRASRARDSAMSKQYGSRRTDQRRRDKAGAFGGYGQGQNAINDRRRGADSRRQTTAGRSGGRGGNQAFGASRSGSRSGQATRRGGRNQSFGGHSSGARTGRSANRGRASRGGGRRR